MLCEKVAGFSQCCTDNSKWQLAILACYCLFSGWYGLYSELPFVLYKGIFCSKTVAGIAQSVTKLQAGRLESRSSIPYGVGDIPVHSVQLGSGPHHLLPHGCRGGGGCSFLGSSAVNE